jgi:hypothetical protein
MPAQLYMGAQFRRRHSDIHKFAAFTLSEVLRISRSEILHDHRRLERSHGDADLILGTENDTYVTANHSRKQSLHHDFQLVHPTVITRPAQAIATFVSSLAATHWWEGPMVVSSWRIPAKSGWVVPKIGPIHWPKTCSFVIFSCRSQKPQALLPTMPQRNEEMVNHGKTRKIERG